MAIKMPRMWAVIRDMEFHKYFSKDEALEDLENLQKDADNQGTYYLLEVIGGSSLKRTTSIEDVEIVDEATIEEQKAAGDNNLRDVELAAPPRRRNRDHNRIVGEFAIPAARAAQGLVAPQHLGIDPEPPEEIIGEAHDRG